VADKLKAVELHRVGSNDDWQILFEYSELPQSDDDSPRLLEETFAVPVRIQLVQLLLDAIVFAHPDCMLCC